MLEGVVPFPPEFAKRYREKGYWIDKSLAQEYRIAFDKYEKRVALLDRDRSITYGELDRMSDNLALNLLETGFQPLDRVVVQLPNVAEFVVLYLALQKIGGIPIAALMPHRFAEISQFVELSGAAACVVPDQQGDFDYCAMVDRIRQKVPKLRHGIVLGPARPGFLSLPDMIAKPATLPESALSEIHIDPVDPAIFQLSGGTTGIPKLIPRTHNDYAYNSKVASSVCAVGEDSVLLVILPIAHNLPLACPGIQGFLFHGGRVVLSTSARPEDVCALIEKHRVTHIKVVPALLIRLLHDPAVGRHDLSSLKIIQSGGQSMLPEVRLLSKKLIPSAFVQENFGMSEGLLMFVRLDDPLDVSQETVGRPVSPDDEVRILDDDDREILGGEVGELCCRGPYTLRGYFGVPEYNARTFTSDGFYRSGDLMRRHKIRQLYRGGAKKGPHQPRRRKNQRRGNRKSHSLPSRGEKRLLCSRARSCARRADVRLRPAARKRQPDFRRVENVSAWQGNRQVQTPRATGNHAGFSVVPVRQSFQKDADGNDLPKNGRRTQRQRRRPSVRAKKPEGRKSSRKL